MEDDEEVRYNIVSYLEDSGFTVIQEGDGARGLRLARRANPDLVLCDLCMPGTDGLTILRTLSQELPNLPLIVVSGTGVINDVVEALRCGAWDFITKPIMNTDTLEHSIKRVLERARLIRNEQKYRADLEAANRKLISNLDMFRQDAMAGRKTQFELMPPPEYRLGNYRFTRMLLPSLFLTGDFIDYFVIKSGYIGFLLADVSGHGAAPAFVTVLLKSFVERYRQMLQEERDDCILRPSELLNRLNKYLIQQHLNRHLTIFYGVIDNNSKTLCYSNGGQFPFPILFDGKIGRFLDTKSLPVGLIPDGRIFFADTQVKLPPYHSIILFSDGILDALSGLRVPDRAKRLLQAVEQHGTSASAIYESFDLDKDMQYPDDITLLVVELETWS
ncbi:hypothetical protein TI04_01745 [Achromatium sp. WMS2]|nr:hypothetical protein TI04_01745 [Achromatium sp. WMS2]